MHPVAGALLLSRLRSYWYGRMRTSRNVGYRPLADNASFPVRLDRR